MFRLIHSNDARILSIKNIIKKLDMGIRTSSENGHTSFEIQIPTNTVLDVEHYLHDKDYIVEAIMLPQEYTKLVIRWG